MLVEKRIVFPSSTSFKDEFSSVEPSAVEEEEEEEELLDGGSGPKDVCSPKKGEPGPESGTLASDRYVGTRAEEDSRGAEREAQAKVSRDLPMGGRGGGGREVKNERPTRWLCRGNAGATQNIYLDAIFV